MKNFHMVLQKVFSMNDFLQYLHRSVKISKFSKNYFHMAIEKVFSMNFLAFCQTLLGRGRVY